MNYTKSQLEKIIQKKDNQKMEHSLYEKHLQ